MLEVIVDRHLILILMGIVTVLGVASKCIANHTLKKLVKAAGNMNKSTHALMRLVRAKFEHACMLSDKVQNVEVFVEKYLCEYKVVGCTLHSLQRTEKGTSFLSLLLGGVGAAAEYSLNGMNDQVLQVAALGGGLAIGLFLLHVSTDEDYQIEVAKNYMVDYLENVCAHRYEKTNQKELQVMAPVDPESADKAAPIQEGAALLIKEKMQAAIAEEQAESRESIKAEELKHSEASRTVEAPRASEATGVSEASRASEVVNMLEAREKSEELSASETLKRAEMAKSANMGKRQDAAKRAESTKRAETGKRTAMAKKEEPVTENAKPEKPISKEVLIREILEEFLA